MRKRFLGFGIPALACIFVAIFAFTRQEIMVGSVFVVAGIVFAFLAIFFLFKDKKAAEETRGEAITNKEGEIVQERETAARANTLPKVPRSSFKITYDDEPSSGYEYSVFTLTRYKNEEAQQALLLFTGIGDKVDIEDDMFEDRVNVMIGNSVIGCLPKAAAERFLTDHVVYAKIEKIEEDDAGDRKPLIKVYWQGADE